MQFVTTRNLSWIFYFACCFNILFLTIPLHYFFPFAVSLQTLIPPIPTLSMNALDLGRACELHADEVGGGRKSITRMLLLCLLGLAHFIHLLLGCNDGLIGIDIDLTITGKAAMRINRNEKKSSVRDISIHRQYTHHFLTEMVPSVASSIPWRKSLH